MKKILLTSLFLFSLGLYAQDLHRGKDQKAEKNIDANDSLSKTNLSSTERDFNYTTDTQNKKNNAAESKFVKRAREYFDKLWYAEAAELYEQALSDDKNNYTLEILEKAGDSHYYNTNMERAHHWYTILYDTFGEEMSPDYLFKYAHSLKGTGKYGRAKRLMRIYNRKKKNENATIPIANDIEDQKEILLDDILKTKHSFELKNVSINSEYSDFSPMYYNENEIVFSSARDSSFFSTRKYKWNNQPFLDLYSAQLNNDSNDLKDPIKFSKKVNTKYHEASVAFSPDNKTMYFTRNNFGKKLKRDKNGINHLKLYMSQKIDDEWTEAVELPFNSDSYSTGHPALSPDGKQLYFVSDMPGSMGETDIFVVDILEDGLFSAPKNLGPEVNTEQKEMFPFITEKKLYFSSTGRVGLGGLDVFEAVYDETGFKDATNLGLPINSNKDDFSFIVNEETQKGFLASNRANGKGDDDIYSFKNLMLEEVNENAISGVITELVTGTFIPKALVTLLDENNIKLKEVLTEEDGSFIFENLDENKKYTIKTTKEDFFAKDISTTTLENKLVSVDVTMRKLKELIVVENGVKRLKTEMIYFNFDKSTIRADAAEELDKLVATMNEYPSIKIKIESHTDVRGNNAYNKYLSDKRAKSTRDYIISRGIDANRIVSAIGYGEERLINKCAQGVSCSRAQHQLNRRSEFIIVEE
ncbi:OmpA family protein [Cellulophaga sp. F20128]|uniref:OmpA family protein n=1 Tax=Cellulophaga sp. F20128 TaxID=2926413 RepID=UPI001FF5C8C8|nr:OmpA family protein [Cellulophaga sp. F20128]MCK0158126.1 OmpA family protein [Cellulophaga sp. F20128]